MELPREVRDMIYEMCLVSDRPIFFKDPRRHIVPQKPEEFDRDLLPIEFSATAKARNLFYVSKQIRDETVAIFYRKNTFDFAMVAMEKFIRKMGVRNRHHLRSVIVYYEGRCDYAHEGPLEALERCVGLRDLTLVFCTRDRHTGGRLGGRHYFMPAAQWPPAWPPAFGNLLQIRGLDKVRLLIDRPHIYGSGVPAKFRDMEAALQVLKQPRRVPQRTESKSGQERSAEEKSQVSFDLGETTRDICTSVRAANPHNSQEWSFEFGPYSSVGIFIPSLPLSAHLMRSRHQIRRFGRPSRLRAYQTHVSSPSDTQIQSISAPFSKPHSCIQPSLLAPS